MHSIIRSTPKSESQDGDSSGRSARWIYIAGLVYLLVGYLATNEFAAHNPLGRPALPIATALDGSLPFTPWTVIFYVLYYPLLISPLLLMRDRQNSGPGDETSDPQYDVRALLRLALAQFAMNSVAYVVFILFPTPIDRPPAIPVEGVFHIILDSLFRADHPYNTFPSLHVGHTCLLALFFMRYRSACRPTFTAGFHSAAALLVAASALLIKQHYVADAMAGALLAWAVAFGFLRPREPR